MASVFPVYKMSKETIFILVGLGLMVFAFWFAIAYSYSPNATSNMTLDCIRMFYSDTWNKGYVSDLAKFCNGG